MARHKVSIVHSHGFLRGDISRQNFLCTRDAVYLIDLAFSSVAHSGDYWEMLKLEKLKALETAFFSEV